MTNIRVYAAVFALVLNNLLRHTNFKEIIVCVITINRYGDNNAHPC